MESKNGYFKLDIRDVGVYLIIYPPIGSGKAAEVKEAAAYLEQKGYGGFNLKELNQATLRTDAIQEVYVGEWNGFEENEQMALTVSVDKMLVFCRFYPPSNKGRLLTKEDILKDLQSQQVKIGIKAAEIDRFLEERLYCTNYILARGIPPVQGKDAKIEYFFNTSHNLKPKKNEDGTVDYHELNTISHVERGQLLARLHKEVPRGAWERCLWQ